jgi:alpha-mannosidase
MANWYHNAMELPTEAEALRERLSTVVEKTSRIALTDHLLGMNGCDHQPVQTDLRRAIALAGEVLPEVQVVQSGFREYLAAIAPYGERFPTVKGEINGQLTKGANPLICTASAHVDVKVDNYSVEHLLARVTEPLCAIAANAGIAYPKDELLYAWKTLMQNHPHDSICTCSVDEVYDEMKVRFAKARAVGEALRDEALSRLFPHAPTASEGDVPVALLSLDGAAVTQKVRFAVDFAEEEGVEAVALFDGEGNEIPATYRRLPHTFTYRLPDDAFRKVTYVTRFEIEADVETRGIGVVPLWVRREDPDLSPGIAVGEMEMENGILRLVFAPDGTFTLTDLRSGETYRDLGRLEDTRDVGNLYNYVQKEGDVPLYAKAKELGCNKIALGHHKSDVIETTLMGMLYGGQVQGMLPKLNSTNFEGMELIRPLYCVLEQDILRWKEYNGLQFIACACRFTESVEQQAAPNFSARKRVKELIAVLKKENPNVENNIFQSIHNVQLDTLVEYKQGGVRHGIVPPRGSDEGKKDA